MKARSSLDMTAGDPFRLLIRFSLPLGLGALFQQLYSFSDAAIIGRFLGASAMTAVGITNPLNQLVLGFAIGSSVGFCIPVSQMVGAEKPEEVNRYFWNGLFLCAAIAFSLSLGIFLLARTLLRFMHTDAALFDLAAQYIRIIAGGQFFSVLYNYFSGILRAFGDSRRPFYFLVISSVLNVLLDLFLVLVIPMGVAGAAVATVISQLVSVVLCIWWLVRSRLVRTRSADGQPLTRISVPHIKQLCVMGMPLGIAHSACYIGNVTLQRFINTLGTVAAAAQICGEKIRAIATLPMEAVGSAMATYVGQNFGAKRMDRIRTGVRAGLAVQALYCIFVWVVLFGLKKPLVSLILGADAPTESFFSVKYLTLISPLFILHGTMQIFRSAVQSIGLSFSAVASALMEIIGRTSAGLLAVRLGSFVPVALSAPTAWLLATACCAIIYACFFRKTQGFPQAKGVPR